MNWLRDLLASRWPMWQGHVTIHHTTKPSERPLPKPPGSRGRA